MTPADLDRFRELLDGFVFFHLGSDARVEVGESEAGLTVSFEHPRVHAFHWRLRDEEAAGLAADPRRFEDAMLEQLTTHRRS